LLRNFFLLKIKNQFPLSLKELRIALGLSQDLMAGLLQTTRSQLSLAELGLRPIGVQILRIQKINLLLEKAEVSFINKDNYTSKIQDWLNLLKADRHRIKKRLGNLKTNNEKNLLLSTLLSQIGDLKSPDFSAQKDHLWKEMIEAAQPEVFEVGWEIFRLSLELETLE